MFGLCVELFCGVVALNVFFVCVLLMLLFVFALVWILVSFDWRVVLVVYGGLLGWVFTEVCWFDILVGCRLLF